MLLTTREIADLCAKYNLTTNTVVSFNEVTLFVEMTSIVFNNYTGNKVALLVLRKAAGTCYRLQYIYNKLAFVHRYIRGGSERESILSLVGEHEDQTKYSNQPHSMAELELMIKKCVEHVRLNEPHVKAFEAKKRIQQMEADFASNY